MRRFLLLLGSLLLPACGRDAPAVASPATVRDSAGVRIVENGAQAWSRGEGWTIAAEPSAVIGREGDPRYEFQRIAGLDRLSDGTIVVLDALAHELRLFTSDGTHIRTLGREGRGPGEFLNPRQLLVAGDTLVVWDNQAGEVTRLLPDGTQLHRRRLDLAAAWEAAVRKQEEGTGLRVATVMADVLPDGSALAFAPGTTQLDPRQPPDDETRWGSDYYLLGRGAEAPVELGRFLGPAGGSGNPDGRSVIGEIWSGVSVLHASSARLGRVAIAGTGVSEVMVFGLDGQPLQRIRYPAGPRPVTEPERSHVSAAQVRDLVERGQSEQEARENVAPVRGTFHPVMDDLVYDRSGHLWVRDFAGPLDTLATWRIFDPEGIYLGAVPGPVAVDLDAIGPDWALGRVQDRFGLETVQLFRLERPPLQ